MHLFFWCAYFLFKTKDVDLAQKRVRQMINGLATCGLNASMVSNSDLRLILENFLNIISLKMQILPLLPHTAKNR